MQLQVILGLLVILAIIIIFITRPFIKDIRDANVNNKEFSVLLAEKENLLTLLRELDFDYSLGKIPEDDYPLQRVELVKRSALVMEELDALMATSSKFNTTQGKHAGKAFTDEEIENLISIRRSKRAEQTRGFCPKCGKAIFRSDKYCPGCGNSLK